MAYGQRDPDALTDRNSDRVRILKFLARRPEGISQTALCHYVLKGVAPNDYSGLYDLSGDTYERHDAAAQRFYDGSDWIALDGSDDDYQFLNRFVNDLEAETDLVRVDALDRDNRRGRLVTPTHRLLDLISEGIRETTSESSDFVYDREYCQNLLKSVRTGDLRLSDGQKSFLAHALRRYINRVEDYRLCFDVHLANRSGYDKRRMEKPYKTRFTDEGRMDKAFARLQSALEFGYESAKHAVFTTLTTDPKKHESLYEAILSINESFHRLTQMMKTDPDTVADTRRSSVPSWTPDLDSSNFHFGAEGAVSGRPRERLEYIKVLEFDGGGKPHLHVLFFDPPTRDVDGMPWLLDKNELSHYWDKYGQGRIVDTYPLTFRDDLDEVGNFGEEVVHDENGDPVTDENDDFVTRPVSEGFVSWYRYGDHDHSQEWVEKNVRDHNLIDMDGLEDEPQQKTAGSYLGKYVSEMYESLYDLNDKIGSVEFEADLDAGDDDVALWKLALYWTTQRQLWSPSNGIRDAIRLDDDRTDIRRGVADATRTSMLYYTERLHGSHALYPDLDRDRAESELHRIVRDLLAERELEVTDASTSSTTLARIEYLGAYHFSDLPDSPDRRVDAKNVESAINDPDEPVVLASAGDRPPPTANVWN
ncbi:hypothetical protein [Natrinema altunense]|nr:hypothetical protein [Natrinema altunense]